MITNVNHVVISNVDLPAANETLVDGEMALLDGTTFKPLSDSEAATAKSVAVGVKKTVGGKVIFELLTSIIRKDAKMSYAFAEYEAPVEAKAQINMQNVTPVVGHRYVIRIVYKDIYEAPGQFTHTYEVVAQDATVKSLVAAFNKKINAHANARVVASITHSSSTNGDILNLTAKVKDDNEGVNSLNEYSRVEMQVSFYETIPGALLSNQPELVAGAKITNTEGKAGKGTYKQVRDLEVRNQGYRGHIFSGAYPAVEPERLTKKDETYDIITIKAENPYLSADNQYIKNTPIQVIACVKHAGSQNASDFITCLKAFMA